MRFDGFTELADAGVSSEYGWEGGADSWDSYPGLGGD
jgi:hypothetical protein